MNIALIALAPEHTPLEPPLTLAYVAALLEQQRHIVRLYDLPLASAEMGEQPARLLRSFRPRAAIIAGDSAELPAAVAAELTNQRTPVLSVGIGRNDEQPTQACSTVLAWLAKQSVALDDPIFIRRRSQQAATVHQLSALPFPARHLIELERYDLRACGGELLTTLLIGQPTSGDAERYELRAPASIVNELRSVAREHGVRHYRFCGAPLTARVEWLRELNTHLCQADLQVEWEGAVQPGLLNDDLLAAMRKSGCEALRFDFDAPEMLESATARTSLKEIVATARQHGIYARAELMLEPPYDSIARLVDVAATFGLDDVQFLAATMRQQRQPEASSAEAMARKLYNTGRSRQHFIERYGQRLGPVFWQVRHSKLLSRLLGEYGREVPEPHEDAVSAA